METELRDCSKKMVNEQPEQQRVDINLLCRRSVSITVYHLTGMRKCVLVPKPVLVSVGFN